MAATVIQGTVAVAGGAVNENVLNENEGFKRYIRPPFNMRGQLLVNVSDALVKYELFVNGRAITDTNAARVEPAAGVLLTPDDIHVEHFSCPAGGQLVLRVANGAVGSETINFRINMEEATEQVAALLVTQDNVTLDDDESSQVLDGRRFERPRVDSYMNVFASAGAVGVVCEVFVDGASIAPPLPVNASNRSPINPYDNLIQSVECPAGKLIELRFSVGTVAAPIAVGWRQELQETVVVMG